MPTPLLPDATVIARQALLAQAPLTALVVQRVYFAIPATPTFPLVVLTLVDDDELRPEALTARVQADVWGAGGDTQSVIDTKTIAATIRSVARDLVGTWAAGSIFNAVAGITISQPDDKTGRSRHIVDLLLDLK